MSRIIAVYKAINKGQEFFPTGNKKKMKIQSKMLNLIIVLGVFGWLGYLVYDFMGDNLAAMGESGLIVILNGGMDFFALFSAFFVLIYSMPTLYLGEDNKIMLPLPVSPFELLLCKMAVVYTNITMMTGMLGLVFFLPTLLAFEAGVSYYIVVFLSILTMPLFGTALGCLINIIIMTVLRLKVDKEKLAFISTLVIIVAVIGYNLLIITEPDFATIISSAEFTKYFMPGVIFAKEAVLGNNIAINMLIVIAINTVAFVGIAFICQKIFYNRISVLDDNFTKKSKTKVGELSIKSTSAFRAYLTKEFKMLFRTTANLTYIFLMGIYMPLVMIISFAVQFSSMEIGLSSMEFSMIQDFVYFFFLGVIVYQAGITQGGLTCISRDGGNAYVMKYLPISIKKQLIAKLIVCLSSAVLPYLMCIGAVIYFVNPPIHFLLAMTLVTIVVSVASTLMQMKQDIMSPKLNWTTKQELFNGLRMLLTLLISVALAAGINVGLYFLKVRGYALIYSVTGIYLLLAIVFYVWTIKDNALNKIEF